MTAPERPYRRCNKCRERKPIEAFSWQYKASGVRHPWCRDCLNAAKRECRLRRLDHYRTVNKAWNTQHRSAMAEANRRYRGRGIVIDEGRAAA